MVAASQGHALSQGVLHSGGGAQGDELSLLACTRCGAWTTAAAQRSKGLLLRPCMGVPSAAGRDVLSRLRRGLHPKSGLSPPLVGLWRPVADAAE